MSGTSLIANAEKGKGPIADAPGGSEASSVLGETAEEAARSFVLYAAWFELAGKTMAYPESDLAEALVSGTYEQEAALLAQELGDSTMNGPGLAYVREAYEKRHADEVLHLLRREYTRLFIGTWEPLVSPYGSWWIATAQGREPIMFLSKECRDVERIMHKAGVGNIEQSKDPLDHVASELEFLQYACLVAAGSETPADGAQVGTSTARSFLSEHVVTWIGHFADVVRQETVEPLYRYAATLLNGIASLQTL